MYTALVSTCSGAARARGQRMASPARTHTQAALQSVLFMTKFCAMRAHLPVQTKMIAW